MIDVLVPGQQLEQTFTIDQMGEGWVPAAHQAVSIDDSADDIVYNSATSTLRLSGDGTLASYTIIRVAPARHAADAPYAVGVVSLTEGASIFGRIVDIPFEKLSVGLPLRFRPVVVNEQTSVGFGP